MISSRLGTHGPEFSRLTFGCGNFGGIGSAPWLFGDGEGEGAAHAVLDAARAAGITMYDTANTYGGGRSEKWLGSWLATRSGVRDEVLITTKVGNRVSDAPGDGGLSAAHIRAQIEISLERLRTDRVDLYLTHQPDPTVPVEETVGAFAGLIEAGKIRYYGLSNTGGADVAAAVAAADALGVPRPVNLQTCYNLLQREGAEAFGACTTGGLGFTAFSPLAGGLLTGKYSAGVPAGSRGDRIPGWYEKLGGESTSALLSRLGAAAAERGVAPATLALAWVLSDPSVAGALVAPRSAGQLELMSAAVELRLTPAERAALVG